MKLPGAVDDAGHPVDAVRREPFAEHLDDRDAGGHGRLERDDGAALAGEREQRVAVRRDQRLVGADDVLVALDRAADQGERRLLAAHRLADDVDVGIADQRLGVVGDLDGVGRLGEELGEGAPRLGDVAYQGPAHGDRAAGAALDLAGVAHQDGRRAAADGAEAEQADADRFQEVPPEGVDASARASAGARARIIAS